MEALSRRLMGGWTDLHVAAAAGDLAKVRVAVQKNPADVDKLTKDRQSALHLAAAGGFDAVVGELLDRHARTNVQDEAGRTPLHVAAVGGHGRCVAALLGPRNREGAAERAQLLGARDREGRDALGAAVSAGQAGAVQELLRGGADAARCKDASGCGLMLQAVRQGHTHLLPLLAPACGLDQRDPATGATPLHVAAAAGSLAPLTWLLAAGASTATRDNAGRTAGEAALAAGQHAAARAIREAALGGPQRPGPAAATAATAAAATAPSVASSSGGGAALGAGGSSGGGYGYGNTHGHGRYDHSLLQPAGPAAAAVGLGVGAGAGYAAPLQVPMATPWQAGGPSPQGMQGPHGGVVGEQAPAAAVGAGRLQIPETLPAPVYYPTPPPGAGVYY